MCDSVLGNQEYLNDLLNKYSAVSELNGELKLILEIKSRFCDNVELIEYLNTKARYINALLECYERNYKI